MFPSGTKLQRGGAIFAENSCAEDGDALRPIKREQLSVEDLVERRAMSIHESFRKGLLVNRDSGNGKFLGSSEWLIVNRSVKIVESGRRLEGLQTFVAKGRN